MNTRSQACSLEGHVTSHSVAGGFPRWIAILAAAALAASAVVINHAPARAAATPTEVAVPTPNSVPEGITLGPDGNLWFTEFQGGKIGRITPSGTITEFTGLTGAPFWITAGPNGDLWFTEATNAVGEMTTAGVLVGEFALPAGGGLDQIAAASDGTLWITEFSGNRIGKVSPDGVVTDVATLPTAGAGPTAIVGVADGNLWFTEQSISKMGRITTAGVVTEFGGLSANSTPAGIAVGPDGNVWFTEFDGNRIGRITLDGTVSEFAVPTFNSAPGSLAAGPDGNIWFTEQNGNKIGRMSPTGMMLEEFAIPTPSSGPGAIVTGPDMALWFTERKTNQVGRVAIPTVVTSTTLTNTGVTSGDFNDPVSLSATLVDSSVTPAVPLPGRSVSFSLNGTDTCAGTTDASGSASCTLTPSEQSGTYTLLATFAGAGPLPASSASTSFVVNPEESAMVFASSGFFANGLPGPLAAALTEDGKKPIPGRKVALSLGSGASAQTCSASTAADGSARCAIDPVNQALGPGQASASFGGDGFYIPASTSASALVFAYAPGGTFVLGDGSATVGSSETFWADTWSSQNTLSGGQGPSSFKGFANTLSSTPPVCGGTWTSDPGNSSGPPPAPLPGYMAVVVSSAVSKSSSTVSGDITQIVIVKTDAGYAPDPQLHGTGTVIAVLC
jgi:streptogramin lyase